MPACRFGRVTCRVRSGAVPAAPDWFDMRRRQSKLIARNVEDIAARFDPGMAMPDAAEQKTLGPVRIVPLQYRSPDARAVHRLLEKKAGGLTRSRTQRFRDRPCPVGVPGWPFPFQKQADTGCKPGQRFGIGTRQTGKPSTAKGESLLVRAWP